MLQCHVIVTEFEAKFKLMESGKEAMAEKLSISTGYEIDGKHLLQPILLMSNLNGISFVVV
jgi:hypothetical protein